MLDSVPDSGDDEMVLNCHSYRKTSSLWKTPPYSIQPMDLKNQKVGLKQYTENVNQIQLAVSEIWLKASQR